MSAPLCPPGLIVVKDLIQRLPAERSRILAYEIDRRERDVLVYDSIRSVTKLHIWDTLKTVLTTGALVFTLVALVGQLAKLGQWITDMQSAKLPVKVPALGGFNLDVGSYVPTSTAIGHIARLPGWDTQDALTAALIVMGLITIGRIIAGVIIWQRSQGLREAGEEVKEEIAVLHAWQKKR
ncbi:MAG: hypothetical protein WCV84_04825 [Patescibacteria group bacterium]